MRTELTELARVHADWLALRQEAVAGNIANADRPGHRAGVAPSFEAVVDGATGTRATAAARAILPSENSVDLASELIEGGRVAKEHDLNAAIAGAFHRMTLAGLGQ